MKKEITIPVYYAETNKGKKIIDEESMREQFESELRILISEEE